MASLFIVVNEDRFLLSHRKEIVVAALAKGYDVTIVAKDTTLHHFPKRKEMKSPFFLNMFYDEGFISWPVSDTIYHYDAIKMQPFPEYVVRFQQPNIYDAMRNEEITPERFTEITEDDYHCKWMNNPVVYGDQLFFSFKYGFPIFIICILTF